MLRAHLIKKKEVSSIMISLFKNWRTRSNYCGNKLGYRIERVNHHPTSNNGYMWLYLYFFVTKKFVLGYMLLSLDWLIIRSIICFHF